MHILAKVLLTVPSIIAIIYLYTFISVDFFKWVSNNIIQFEFQALMVYALTIPQIVYLIYRLWNMKGVGRKEKSNWTVLLIIFNSFAALFYIWKKDSVFVDRYREQRRL